LWDLPQVRLLQVQQQVQQVPLVGVGVVEGHHPQKPKNWQADNLLASRHWHST
jgi:hypothetical protein